MRPWLACLFFAYLVLLIIVTAIRGGLVMSWMSFAWGIAFGVFLGFGLSLIASHLYCRNLPEKVRRMIDEESDK